MGVLNEGVRRQSPGSDGVVVWFISPHGFGHAARASAIIAACSARRPDLRHHLFTTVPPGFFSESLPGVSVAVHRLECDVGMVQKNPFEEDVGATIRALARLPLKAGPDLDAVVNEVAATGCRVVVSDISPLGLLVADRLECPGILVENFTWDWIYRAYDEPRLDALGAEMERIFSTAAVRIQTEPVCTMVDGSRVVPPVSRRPRVSRTDLRKELGIPAHERMILVSLGGVETAPLRRLRQAMPTTTLVAPANRPTIEVEHGVVRIPITGGPYHPDLVAASDLVIGKLGYSTVAEVYRSKTRFAFLRRPRFPESPILEAFVRDHIPSAALQTNWLENPTAPAVLEGLLSRSRLTAPRENGAGQAADSILNLLQDQF
ncbi:MAG: hypothetical protein AB1Z65_02475 [Candidatus Sulfomarinibacteraceae bacterium]